MLQDGESRELRCLAAITAGRAHFCHKLVEHASLHFHSTNPDRRVEDLISILRGDNTYYIAEFFYLMTELDLHDPNKFRMLIAKHNFDMENLKTDRARIILLGLNSVQRVEEAIFTIDQQHKIFDDNGVDENGKVRLDQSDLSKLMTMFMSAESCRQTVVALSEGGLLNRRGHGKVFVSPNGSLECYFRAHLTIISESITRQD